MQFIYSKEKNLNPSFLEQIFAREEIAILWIKIFEFISEHL